MDRIATDSERAERSDLYGLAYDLAREQIALLGDRDESSAPDALMRRLVAIVGRDLGDDGTARKIIGWAAEDAVAGWGPRMTIRFTPKAMPRASAEPGTHDGTLGRSGELRGRPEVVPGEEGPRGQDVMFLDDRNGESPRQSMDRRFERLLRARESASERGEAPSNSGLKIEEIDPATGPQSS